MTAGETSIARLGRPHAKVDVLDLVRLMGHGPTLDRLRATAIAYYEPMAVPAPLRTPEYAEAFGDDPVDHAALRDRDCVFYLHESAFHLRVGDDRVMAAQREALADAPWRVRLVLCEAGAHPCLLRPFEYLEFTDAPPVAYSGGRADVVAGHRDALAHLDRIALSDHGSRLWFAAGDLGTTRTIH
ncbi:Scr1 family TA system antitoxin-like transcriptional regulator [Actinosynnema sp. NPDC020468]|uniref:Scr1 family TA system antitoxin-like transcriptional regulator n=1 Tax=Actinosynnema sp. NPDC020468 TaxID=3154488 RepID=UPI00340052D2